jgi:RHS repeat-associated protein
MAIRLLRRFFPMAQQSIRQGLSENRSGTSAFYHPDAIGSTRDITNSTQTVTDTRRFDAFGMLAETTGSNPTPFGFVGGEQYQTDTDSGLLLLGHRYYDNTTGRFISRDPAYAGGEVVRHENSIQLGVHRALRHPSLAINKWRVEQDSLSIAQERLNCGPGRIVRFRSVVVHSPSQMCRTVLHIERSANSRTEPWKRAVLQRLGK